MKDNIISRRNFIRKGLVGMLGFSLMEETLANKFSNSIVSVSGETSNSTAEIIHHDLGPYYDTNFIESPNPALDIYIFDEGTSLKIDGELVNSMGQKTFYISGRGLSQPTPANITSSITDFLGENNMTNKKINMELYQRADDGGGGYTYNKVGTYSGWNMHESGQPIQLTVSNGITVGEDFYPSHKLEVSFIDNSDGKADYDYNNDGKRDMGDFGVLAGTFGQTGNHMADTTGPENKSDGFVGFDDLVAFIENGYLQ